MDADPQLRAIAGIVRAVDAELWLRGGWAKDFFLGEVTRPHRDIDFFCRDIDADRITARLAVLGYERCPATTPCNGTCSGSTTWTSRWPCSAGTPTAAPPCPRVGTRAPAGRRTSWTGHPGGSGT